MKFISVNDYRGDIENRFEIGAFCKIKLFSFFPFFFLNESSSSVSQALLWFYKKRNFRLIDIEYKGLNRIASVANFLISFKKKKPFRFMHLVKIQGIYYVLFSTFSDSVLYEENIKSFVNRITNLSDIMEEV